jgi:predicted GNAT family N-acyltransferase
MKTPADADLVVSLATSREDREACLALRYEVFVEEQRVPRDEELDDLEEACAHFVARRAGRADAAGTARLYMTAEGQAKAQRVAVRASERGRGVGAALMRALEREAAARGSEVVVLAAQVSAIPFYERLGYEAYGGLFWDAGIEHRWMKRRIA